MEQKKNARLPYFDFLRGIAILMVIGIHTYVNPISFDGVSSVITILTRQSLNCAVPIFLAISGFFLGQKVYADRSAHLKFLRKQIPKIYIPCLLWSLPYLCLMLYKGTSLLLAIPYFLLCGCSIYYFIILIIQYYCLLPFIQKLGNKALIPAFALSLVSIIVVTFVVSVKGISLPLIVYGGPFPVFICFFTLGVVLSGMRRDYSLKLIVAFLIVGLFFSLGESFLIISVR